MPSSAVSARPCYKSRIYKKILNKWLFFFASSEHDCLVWYQDFILKKLQEYSFTIVPAINS